MLRTRLLYGLVTLILLLWSVGAAALLLVQDANKRFATLMEESFPVIQSARGVRTATSTLNSYYLPALASQSGAEPVGRSFFDERSKDLDARLAFLSSRGSDEPRWKEAIASLDGAIKIYKEGYERLFGAPIVDQTQRADLLQHLSSQTQRITDISETVLSIAEVRLNQGIAQLGAEKSKNTLFVVTLVSLGTAIAVLIYFQLVRQMVDPVVGLKRSIDEIRRGNFELTLPEPSSDSEFRGVATAFNDMAAELRQRRGETDDRLIRTHLVNRAILEAIPSPVFVLGKDGRILQINPAAERLTEGLGVAGRLPAKIQRILDDTDISESNHLPEDPREALLFRIDEREFYYLPRIFRFTSEDGVHSGRAVLLHNVTRIRWLDDMKTNLLSTVSHEIKTPLTGIRMVLHLMLEDRAGNLSDRQRTMVASANEDCERLLETLNTLLDLSRAESGTTHLELVSTSLPEALGRAERLFFSKAGEKGVTFHREIEEGQPEVCADPLRLDEVVNNLVSNAIKHSPAGGKITLKITRPNSDHLRASIIDEGAGVPLSAQGRIFERFFRAPGQSADGVGLGLFISREIMRAHEGKIGLLDRADKKTEFYIDVPLA
ncbi:ATP-binding protein [Luteolibacter flavescens]|uniref:histidine kinase n=1 Tax=Luteolibacter flavescens TaxID=1859460 RepID=A0ABT3FUW5_9BACT|nr:ATP-binding protein [Luteolibacter flavescens]MCW1887212.1 ATP-binding protein [Luteolibacter flavescens]